MNTCAGTIVGYLRLYRRWNGTPGLTLDEQRALVREIAREREYGRCRWIYHVEQADGEARGWPVLKKVLEMAEDEDKAKRGLLVVVPTLDGVQFNLSFLGLLTQGDLPVYVRSGRRRPKVMGRGTNYAYRSKALGWLLSLSEQADDFAEIVERVRQRNSSLAGTIREGLHEAAARGVDLGGRRRGAHRFTATERCSGGRKTANQRRLAANQPYLEWIPHIRRWRAEGQSFGWIAMRLAAKGAKTPAGQAIGPMLVYRILKRALTGTEAGDPDDLR